MHTKQDSQRCLYEKNMKER